MLTTEQPLQTGAARRPVWISVWDPFVRLFHWSLVVMFASAWYSGGIWDKPHIVAGYSVLLLIVARIVWGFAGSKHARFSEFMRTPLVTATYISDMLHLRAVRYVGHNPGGAVMVIVLLVTLSVLCISGVMMTTDAFWGVKMG